MSTPAERDAAAQLFGVATDADRDTILRRFRMVSEAYHPDVAGSDPAAARRRIQLMDALDVLLATEEQDPPPPDTGASEPAQSSAAQRWPALTSKPRPAAPPSPDEEPIRHEAPPTETESSATASDEQATTSRTPADSPGEPTAGRTMRADSAPALPGPASYDARRTSATPAPPQQSAAPPTSHIAHADSFQTLSRRQLFLASALVLYLCVGVATIVVDALELDLLSQIEEGARVTQAEIESSDNRIGIVAGLSVVSVLAIVIVFLMWIYRAYENAQALTARPLKFSPGWAIGSWFVPVLNFWRPYQIVMEIWHTSTADQDASRSAGSPWLLRGWWVLWIIGGFFNFYSLRAYNNAETIDDLQASVGVDLFSTIVGMAAAVALLLITYRISDGQQKRVGR